MKINIFWFRRDLRLDDNTALTKALSDGLPVVPLFILDTNITDELPVDDSRISFIYDSLSMINKVLNDSGSSVYIVKGNPINVWELLTSAFDINKVYANKDYEAYAIRRDESVSLILKKKNIEFLLLKDQVIFGEREILKSDQKPYTIFTPYKNKWLQKFRQQDLSVRAMKSSGKKIFHHHLFPFPSLKQLGFERSRVSVKPYDLSHIRDYDKFRDFPALDLTTHLGPYLRFGVVSIRKIVKRAAEENEVFLSELVWREFFMQILFNFPEAVTANFNSKYDGIEWRNNEHEFRRWCDGETGYPIVDAGMRQLNRTGFVHNRVRMIAAGFLCKHLLIDWRWGEAYFAGKLNDYELSSNNGNWQWAAGTGCDAAPYFRIFNPYTQEKKFDPSGEYVKMWVEEFGKPAYPQSIVDHEYARKRAIDAYRAGLRRSKS